MTSPRTDVRRIVAWLLFGIAALLALLAWVIGIPVRKARAQILAGDGAAAMETLEPWARTGLRAPEYEQLLAAAALLSGAEGDAERWLGRASRRAPDWFPALSKTDAGRLFISRGLYEEFLRWDAAVRSPRRRGEVALYRAAAQLGAGRDEEARATLERIDRDEVEAERLAALERALERRREGSYPLVADRGGRALAVWQAANEDLVAVNTDFAALLDRRGGELTFEARLGRLGTADLFETTLDARLQKAALDALGGHRGALVAIDAKTHEILAAASSPGGGDERNLAFAPDFEPGSVVKVLTELAARDAGVAPEELFPLRCEGFIEIGGRQFFDWAVHGELSGPAEAMAVSCNVAFARLGLKLGRERLTAVMSKARFGEKADLGGFEVPLGRQVVPVDHDFMLANFAIGLEVQRVSALHLAMLADMAANRGVMTTPRLIAARVSVLGDRTALAPPFLENRVVSATAAERTLPSLREVVTNVRGTGRRAAIEGLDIAMKTGTAGDAVGGYDALVIAFAPADDPRIAIGIIAENAGPAEIAGAAIARAFLSAFFEK